LSQQVHKFGQRPGGVPNGKEWIQRRVLGPVL
jgi:hypothetical protein